MPTLADHFSNLVKQKTQNLTQTLSLEQQTQLDALITFAKDMTGQDFNVVSGLHPKESTLALFFIDPYSPVGELFATIPLCLEKQTFSYHYAIKFTVSPSLARNGPAVFDLTDPHECIKAAELLTDEVVLQMRDENRIITALDYVDAKTAAASGPTGP